MTRIRFPATVAGFLLACALPVLSLSAQETRIGGFADAFFRDSDDRSRGPSGFGLGQFDLYVSSKLSDRVRFLGETVFEYDQNWLVDVERVIISYTLKPWAEFSFGKHHTPIGYWNTAFHHGTLLQPTALRPDLVLFEDEGGVLPIHTTGLQVSGRDIGSWHVGYDVLLGNGIGSTPTEDDNPSKSLTLAGHVQATSALRIGTSAYFDRISASTPTLTGGALGSSLSQQILGAYVAYLGSDLEVMGEFQRVSNTPRGGKTRVTNGGYAYAGRRIGDWVPYARYDAILFAAGDTWFGGTPVRSGTIGLRHDLGSAAVVKLEMRRERVDGQASVTRIVAQFAIGY